SWFHMALGRYLSLSRLQPFGSGGAAERALTIRSSRTRFAGRLNSGVSTHETTAIGAHHCRSRIPRLLGRSVGLRLHSRGCWPTSHFYSSVLLCPSREPHRGQHPRCPLRTQRRRSSSCSGSHFLRQRNGSHHVYGHCGTSRGVCRLFVLQSGNPDLPSQSTSSIIAMSANNSFKPTPLRGAA